MAYFRVALALCRARGVEPSLLLHPLDFLGADDDADLAFFPAMDLTGQKKRAFVHDVLKVYGERYDVVPMKEHALRSQQRRLKSISANSIHGTGKGSERNAR